jgi:ribonuclease P/MRP protein subunit POP5
MVRTKHRWLLLHLQFEKDDLESGLENKNNQTSTTTTTNNNTPMQLRLLRSIRDSIQHSFGDVGSGALGGAIAVRYYSPSTQNAIVRCSRLGLNNVWASITLCNQIGGKRVRMIVKHCSGTIRKVQQATIRADRKQIERLYFKRKQLAQKSASITFANLQSTQDTNHQDTSVNHPITLDQIAKDALEQSKRDSEAIEQ